MAILIKRYANRKLYNTETSRYITLKGIAELIEQGEEVRVIDNATGEDITSIALSQILVDNERSNRSVPGTVLTDLIQRSGDALYNALRRSMGDASESLEEFQRNVRRMIRKEGEREGGGRFEWSPPDLDRIVHRTVDRVLKALDLPRRSDIESLNRNLLRVAEAIEGLERRSGGAAADPAGKPPEGSSPSGT